MNAPGGRPYGPRTLPTKSWIFFATAPLAFRSIPLNMPTSLMKVLSLSPLILTALTFALLVPPYGLSKMVLPHC